MAAFIGNNEEPRTSHEKELRVPKQVIASEFSKKSSSYIVESMSATFQESISDASVSKNAQSDITQGDPKMHLSVAEHLLAFATFTLLGTSAMAFFNSFIQALYSIQVFLFPNDVNMSDTLTAAYLTSSFFVTTAMIVFKVLNPRLLYFGAAGFATAALALPMVCQWKGNSSTGLILMHLLLVLGGSCTAAFESSMFSVASIMPRNYVGAACFGLGASGTFAFAIWMLLSKGIFDQSDTGVQRAVWAFFVLCAVINVLSALLFAALFRRPVTKICIENANEQRRLKNGNSGAPHGEVSEPAYAGSLGKVSNVTAVHEPASVVSSGNSFTEHPKNRRSTWEIYKAAAEPILNVSITLWLTLMLYPNVAPFSWRMTVVQTDVTIGLCTLGDFFGRYLPNLRRQLPWLTVKKRNLKYFTAGRLLFIPIFILIAKSRQTVFPLQMIVGFLFQLSNGWICSLGTMYVPESVDDEDEKAQTSPLYLVSLLFAMTIGVWMAKLWKL